MIYKSYLVEQNINILKNNLILIFGENLGLTNEFQKKIREINKTKKIIKFSQDDILKNQNILFNEVNNMSLFEDTKIIFIDSVNDKILQLIKEIQTQIDKNKIFLIGNILEKKSKLRNYFEKSDVCDVVACYKDNEINIKNLINYKLKGYNGVTPQITKTLIENSGLDRIKLNNEIDKIKSYFNKKIIKVDQLNKLLNLKTEEDFDSIKDSALKGDNSLTNKLLSSTIFEIEKIPLYLTIVNQRLNKLKEVLNLTKKENLTEKINNIKPPIFWKDKPNFLNQAKIWNIKKLNIALKKTYELELSIKSKANVNKDLLIKKLILDICVIANSW